MHVVTLVRAARAGDRAAWEQLVERFTPLVWSIARAHRLGHADAADVTQTTWLRLLEHIDGVRDEERVGAWIATTARHECLRILRRSGRDVLTDSVPEDSVPSALDAQLLADERDAALWTAFAGLSERCQTLLRLLVTDPAPSYEEIASALGVPIGSIGPTRGRCLERLRTEAAATGITAAAADS